MLQTVYISSLPEQGRSRSIASQSSPPEFDQVTSYLPMSSPEEEPSKSQTPTENGESHYKPEPSPSETEPVLEQLPTAPAPEPEQLPPGSEPEPETSPSEPEIASDPIPEQSAETEIQSSDAVIEAEPEIEKEAVVPAAEKPVTVLRKDEGSRKFTMRELLDELKVSEASESEKPDPVSPYSHRSKQMDQNDIAMELINSVTGVDEEGRSRQRILTYAARRYATAIERNPEDHDAFYNWALVLQESADNVAPDSSSPSKDALLEEACKKYDETTRLCPTLHDAYYNWAIAISDRAKMRGRTKEAEELWKQATKNYEKAVQLNWNSPQALNNWGLALQELSAIVPVREKESIVRDAISKFRASIRLQFDFHRAIYNLGTVLYGLAEDTSRSGEPVGSKDVSANELYSQSAIYIAVAHALKANYSVYHSALRLVRSMLPLPYLKVGHLTAPPPGKAIAPHSDWKRSEFTLNQEGLHQLGAVSGNKSGIKVEIPDIVSVSACADLTLPPGAGMCIDTIHGPVYMVADSWESLDGWLDAIRLVYTIFARGKSDVLAGIITG